MGKKKDLKIKFKLNGLEFEAEGHEDSVREEFSSFKAFISQDLLNTVSLVQDFDSEQIIDEPAIELPQKILAKTPDEMPMLREIVMKDLPASESEWLLVYGFYSSDFGGTTFTKDSLRSKYEETGRKSKSRINNINNNIKTLINNDLLKYHNDNEFLIKEAGRLKIFDILKGENKKSRKPKTVKNIDKSIKTRSSKKKTSSRSKFKLDKNLNLKPSNKQYFVDFAAGYDLRSNPKIIVVGIFYLTEVLEIEQINGDHVYTLIDELNRPIPGSLEQILKNTRTRKGWLDYSDTSDIKLSQQGRNAVKFELKNN